MFFRCRARRRFFKFLLILLGIRILTHGNQLTDTEREEYRAKAKKFRRKIRDAFTVWDEDEPNDSNGVESGENV